MKFYMYGRTPRKKTPRWFIIVLISFFAFLAAFYFMVGIVMSIDTQSIYPVLITFCSIAFVAFLIATLAYYSDHSYIEIDGETIKIIEYPFFKKRERIVLLHDIKKVKWSAGGPGHLSLLMFKNEKNKNLFHLDYVPEVIDYVYKLGFKIEY
ncbi:MAG: hypothetical protein J6M35_01235 [Clostridia bacterium]|nr:hypothetical protein [Clostridia bacterium]